MPLPAGPIRETFEFQADYCAGPGQSPLTARICRLMPALLDDTTALGRRVLGWPAETVRADALALRVAAGFHALVRSQQCSALSFVYPPNLADDHSFRAAFETAIARHDDTLAQWLDRPPQTNETGRSAIILGAALFAAKRFGLPLELFEIGASAGLNSNFSRYHYDLGSGRSWGDGKAPVLIVTDWRGDIPDPATQLDVRTVSGCDLNPIDPVKDGERLMAYLWADQEDRLSRMAAALDFARSHPPEIEKADAADWVERHLVPETGTARLLYHTIVWQYLPEKTKARIETAMAQAGETASADAPLIWFRMEADDKDAPGAGLTMRVWPGGETLELGRADFHGRWVDWRASWA